MRIAVVSSHFPLSSETFVYSQVVGLIRLGHDVQVFSNPPLEGHASNLLAAGDGTEGRINYFPWCPPALWKRLPKALLLLAGIFMRNPRGGFTALRHLPKVFGQDAQVFFDACAFWRHARMDVVLCHFGYVGLRIAPLRELGLIEDRLAVIFHGADISSFIVEHGPHVYRSLFSIGDLFLPVSQRWADALVQYGCPKSKVKVVHMGIDCNTFEFHERRLAAGAPVKLLSVCRFVEKKGLEFAIRAFAASEASRHQAIYTIVGDGPLKPHLEELIKSLDVAASVKLVGWRKPAEVRQMLNDSHILVAPSVTAADGDQEGIPVAIMEAMALGLPVLSTRHSGIPELVVDGESGLLADERDVAGLAERMSQLMSSPGTWGRLGTAGRRKVAEEFNQHALEKDLESLLRGLSAAS